MRTRRAAAVFILCAGLGLSGAACSSTESGNGAITDLGEVGPDIAALKLEVRLLREEVRALREELATVTTTTAPLR